MKKQSALAAFFLICLLFGVNATVPRLLTVQGRLKEAGSSVSGDYDIVFYIYNTETGGSPLYTESHTGNNAVSVSAGFFSTVLGEIETLDLPFKEQYWLGIKVGSDDEMTPRIKLTNSSYAFVARDLNVSENLNIDSGTLYADISNNRVGIGTVSPQQKLEIAGNGVRISGVATPMLELHPSTGDQWRAQAQNDSTFSIYNSTDGKTYLTINGSGDIGIEKTPSYKLDVNGIVNAAQYYQGGSPLISGYWTQSGNNIYYNDGNVGIGTTSPGAKLDVVGRLLLADRAGGNTAKYSEVLSRQYTAGEPGFPLVRGYSNTVDNYVFVGGGHSKFNAATLIQFVTASSPITRQGIAKMTITSDGNVGIGTTGPDTGLHVYDSTSNAILTVEAPTDTRESRIYLKGNQTGQDGEVGKVIGFNSADSLGYMYFLRQDADNSGEISFGTQNAGSLSEAMRIDKAGNVGIGTTSPGAKLDVDGSIISDVPVGVSSLTCSELGWGSGGGTADCGESEVWGGSACLGAENSGSPYLGTTGGVTWPEARLACELIGARLCTRDEIKAGAAKGTGCGHDANPNWTSTSCGNQSYYAVRGDYFAGGADEVEECLVASATSASGSLNWSVEIAVRCCADN